MSWGFIADTFHLDKPSETPETVRVVNKIEIERAILGITRGFRWSDSDEGIDYWREVCQKLEHYAFGRRGAP